MKLALALLVACWVAVLYASPLAEKVEDTIARSVEPDPRSFQVSIAIPNWTYKYSSKSIPFLGDINSFKTNLFNFTG